MPRAIKLPNAVDRLHKDNLGNTSQIQKTRVLNFLICSLRKATVGNRLDITESGFGRNWCSQWLNTSSLRTAFFSDAGKLSTKAFLSRSCCLGPLVRRYETGRWEVPQIDQRNRTLNELHDTRNYETTCAVVGRACGHLYGRMHAGRRHFEEWRWADVWTMTSFWGIGGRYYCPWSNERRSQITSIRFYASPHACLNEHFVARIYTSTLALLQVFANTQKQLRS